MGCRGARTPRSGHVGRHLDALHLDHVVAFLAQQPGHMLAHGRARTGAAPDRAGGSARYRVPGEPGFARRWFRDDDAAVGAQQVQRRRFRFSGRRVPRRCRCHRSAAQPARGMSDRSTSCRFARPAIRLKLRMVVPCDMPVRACGGMGSCGVRIRIRAIGKGYRGARQTLPARRRVTSSQPCDRPPSSARPHAARRTRPRAASPWPAAWLAASDRSAAATAPP